MYIQDLAGVAHDDIDLSVFSISGDDQKVRCPPPLGPMHAEFRLS